MITHDTQLQSRPERLDTSHLDALSRDIRQRMLFRKCHPINSMKQQVFAFSESVRELIRWHEGMLQLINAAAEAICDSEDGRKVIRRHVPSWNFSVPEVLGMELADLDDEELWTHLGDTLCEQTNRLVAEFQQQLDNLVDLNLLGLVEWKRSKRVMCRYTYFRGRVGLKQLGEKREEVGRHTEYSYFAPRVFGAHTGNFRVIARERITKDMQKELFHTFVEHHLFNPQQTPWPAKTVPKPPHVTNMMQKIPECFHPYLFVVHGDMCKEVMKTSVVWRQKFQHVEEIERVVDQGPLYSPAVVFGDVVLTGWSDGDL